MAIVVEYNDPPEIAPNGSAKIKITIKNKYRWQQHFHLRWLTPSGWTVAGLTNLTTYTAPNRVHEGGKADDIPPDNLFASGEFTVTASEVVDPVNRLVLEVTCPGRPSVGYASVIFMG